MDSMRNAQGRRRGRFGRKRQRIDVSSAFFAAFDVYVSGIYFAVQRFELISLDVL